MDSTGGAPITGGSAPFHAASKLWDQAEADLAELLRIRPNDPQVHVEAYRTFADHGQWDWAAAEHAAAVRLRPADV
jgi:predicted Zn-dependent protease